MRKGADVLSKWVGEAERQLRLLFEEVSETCRRRRAGRCGVMARLAVAAAHSPLWLAGVAGRNRM